MNKDICCLQIIASYTKAYKAQKTAFNYKLQTGRLGRKVGHVLPSGKAKCVKRHKIKITSNV